VEFDCCRWRKYPGYGGEELGEVFADEAREVGEALRGGVERIDDILVLEDCLLREVRKVVGREKLRLGSR
jgi:hypothetical protein